MVRFDTHPLEHAHKEIAQRWVVILVEGQMLTMLEASASQQNRHIFDTMPPCVAQVAAEENGRPVEQTFTVLPGLSELCQKGPQCFHFFQLKNFELSNLDGILTVVRQVMMSLADALDRRHVTGAEQLKRDQP